jgi:serine/threonine protein kinase
MFYAMLYGELPFWGETEDELVLNICKQPLRFPKRVPVTEGARELLRLMLAKDPVDRAPLLDLMTSDYNMLEDGKLKSQVDELTEHMKTLTLEDEEKKKNDEKDNQEELYDD